MDRIDNNQFEVKPCNSKRKIAATCPNVYLNPALDLLTNEDPMCNTAMEIVPNKKRKRTRSCGDIAAFENSALDIGVSKAAINEFLARELENVRKNVRSNASANVINKEEIEAVEPIYGNLSEITQLAVNDLMADNTRNTTETISQNQDIEISAVNEDMLDSGISVMEQKSLSMNDEIKSISPITNVQTNITNQLFINNSSNLSLSFIDRLALDSPNISNQSLYYDDDLNESNIMEIKTITIITKKKRIKPNNTNPFLEPNVLVDNTNLSNTNSSNPFLNLETTKAEVEYSEEVLNRPPITQHPVSNAQLQPRKLFGDTNSTISTVNESLESQHEYENIDSYRSESPIYENIDDAIDLNKQSKILGHDVSQFRAVDIMNLNKNSQQDCSCDSNDSKKSKKHFLKVGNKLSKKVFKTLKKTFIGDKVDANVTLNPYEVPRKQPKQKDTILKDSGIENPALNLDNSDEIEIEELEGEHEYETVKTIRNTHLNMNITPLKERNDNDLSSNKATTPGKKVRFDSTLNQEKVITGNSFEYDVQSPGFDAKIDMYHDELENCINERKILQQNM